MSNNQLGNTDIRLSAIGLGTWAIGGGGYGFGWGPQDDKQSIDTIHRAIDLGINWIDTAPVYGLGHSEKIVGQAIKGKRDKLIISTKCGIVWGEYRNIDFNLDKESVRAEVDESLKRLKIDVIDLYQIHKPMPEEKITEAWGVLADLVKEGKIRYAGVSSFSLEQLKQVQPIHPVAFLQPEYNMLQPGIEPDILEYCSGNHIGVIVYSPMCSGLLTGKFTREKVEALPADDWRRESSPYFQEPYFSANLQLVETLRVMAQRNNRTVAQLAIAWVLRRPEVTSAIVGARRPSQIEETAPAGDWVLSIEDKKEMDDILKDHHTRLEELKAKEEK
ncbi:MAG: aldo/keto reductase [Candidatus Aminicenantes bacterium]|jgi:aryl-alcohol dehydrogenase-like predicted oxidoreductase